MTEKDKRTIDELLAAYPDILVSRDRMGCMIVFIDNGIEPKKRLFLSLGRDTLDEEKPHLTIAILPEKKEGEYSYIKIFPVSTDNARVETEGLPREVDSQEIIEKAKQGLELFRGTEAVGFAEFPYKRVYDWMQAGDDRFMRPFVAFVEAELERAKKAGLLSAEVKYAHPSEHYLMMLEIINLRVA